MSEQLYHYYNEQLSYLRNQGKAFAEAHPKIAGNLQLGSSGSDDPLVERLLEGFAFLAGRVQHNIEQGNQTITSNLLSLLYPHFERPLPAFSIFQFQPVKQLTQESIIPKHTLLRTNVNTQYCKFRTCYPIYLTPLELFNVEWKRHYGQKPTATTTDIKSCLSFKLKTLQPSLSICKLNLNKIRIYINLENPLAYSLYEILHTQLAEISITSALQPISGIKYSLDNLKFVGFEAEDAILPFPPNSSKAYALLTEFFSYPQKFLFFDLEGLNSLPISDKLTELQINFFLTTTHSEAEKAVNDDSFLLNCAPIVNLFRQQAEPIRVDHSQTEYPIIADNNIPANQIEVYSVESMEVTNIGGTAEKIFATPYFGKKYTMIENQNHLYWHLRYKNCWELGEYHLPGSEVFVIFSMLKLMDNFLVTPELLCSNREAILAIPIGATFQIYPETIETIAGIKAMTSFTKPRYRKKESNKQLDLLTHMSINQLGYDSKITALEALKNTLAIYNVDNKNENLLVDKGIQSVTTRTVTRRNSNSLKQGFCQGIEYTLTIDEQYFLAKNMFLFAKVLRFFLQRMCSINSFVQLVLESKQRGMIKQWKPLLGTKKIL